jgi:hypothetical protein
LIYSIEGWGGVKKRFLIVMGAVAILSFMNYGFPAWGRDPFELPPGVGLLKTTEEAESANDIKSHIKKVTAILITDSRKVASINHKVVTIGDLIDGERVLEIKPDRVVLENGGRRHVIMLEEDIIQWKKSEGDGHEK